MDNRTLRPRVKAFIDMNYLIVNDKDIKVLELIDELFEEKKSSISKKQSSIKDDRIFTVIRIADYLKTKGIKGYSRDNLNHNKQQIIKFIREREEELIEPKKKSELDGYKKKQDDINRLNIKIINLENENDELKRKIRILENEIKEMEKPDDNRYKF